MRRPERRDGPSLPTLLGAAMALLGCGASAPQVNAPDPSPALDVVRLPGAEPVALDTLAALLADAEVIYVGERHDSPEDHAVQAALIRLARPPILGMEMFERPVQPVLDAYAQGALDEAELLERTDWAERWGMPFELYADVVRAGREAGGRIVALNAPRDWTRAISRSGLEGLPPELRAALPDLDTTHHAHRAMVMAALSGHAGHGGGAMDAAMLERFYLAQLAWDETMGDTVARTLEAQPSARMVVLAGRLHVQQGLGIPRCAARRHPHRALIVLPLTDAEIAAEQAHPIGLADLAVRVP